MTDPHWVRVAAAADVVPGVARCVTAAGVDVALFNVDGEICAVENRCPHKDGQFVGGLVRHGIVTCPLHFWRFDVRRGERIGEPAIRLVRYRTRVRDGQVEVLVPPPRPGERGCPPGSQPRSMREVLLERARAGEPVSPPPSRS